MESKRMAAKRRIAELTRRVTAANTMNKRRYALLSNPAVALNKTERKTLKSKIDSASAKNKLRLSRIAKLKKIAAGK
jgi:hypothetical protein